MVGHYKLNSSSVSRVFGSTVSIIQVLNDLSSPESTSRNRADDLTVKFRSWRHSDKSTEGGLTGMLISDLSNLRGSGARDGLWGVWLSEVAGDRINTAYVSGPFILEATR